MIEKYWSVSTQAGGVRYIRLKGTVKVYKCYKVKQVSHSATIPLLNFKVYAKV